MSTGTAISPEAAALSIDRSSEGAQAVLTQRFGEGPPVALCAAPHAPALPCPTPPAGYSQDAKCSYSLSPRGGDDDTMTVVSTASAWKLTSDRMRDFDYTPRVLEGVSGVGGRGWWRAVR